MGTTTNMRAIYLSLSLVVAANACRGREPMPCPDCYDAADDVREDLPPDLPCGGADLLSDPLNCGSCSNSCLSLPGTEWEAGACQSGECVGPWWTACEGKLAGATCEEICGEAACVPNGCSGYTALLYPGGGADFYDCDAHPPDSTMSGPCDVPIPWESSGSSTHARCCCG